MALTESDGSPRSDPYDHIHGREFWVNKPGLYVMNVRLVDTSRNGLNQEPIHAPSEILSLYLQSRATLQAELRADGQLQVTFAVRAYEAWVLEESAKLATGSVWTVDEFLYTQPEAQREV